MNMEEKKRVITLLKALTDIQLQLDEMGLFTTFSEEFVSIKRGMIGVMVNDDITALSKSLGVE